jgi:hypothetical protein
MSDLAGNQEHAEAKIADCSWSRHALLLFVAFFTLVLCAPALAKDPDSRPLITERDADVVIVRYRSPAASEQVALWSGWSRAISRPAPEGFRRAAVNLFPEAWRARRNTDPAVAHELRSLLHPLFSLYGVEYEFYILNTSKPSIFLDNDAVLVLTTGLVSRARGDAELLGFMAHEVAHAQFGQRTAAAKGLYSGLLAAGRGESDGARQTLRELALIELECDAIAARTLVTLGFNPAEFIEAIERVEQDFPKETGRGGEYGVDWHPATAVRLRVVTALSAQGGTRKIPTRSARLKALQDLLDLPNPHPRP